MFLVSSGELRGWEVLRRDLPAHGYCGSLIDGLHGENIQGDIEETRLMNEWEKR